MHNIMAFGRFTNKTAEAIDRLSEITCNVFPRTFTTTLTISPKSPVDLRFFLGDGFDKKHPLKGKELARFLKVTFRH